MNINYDGSSSGYASSITATDIVKSGVLGVIGNEFSSAAVLLRRASSGEAEILSNYKIPYCSAASSSPRFSNKNNYPFFWRALASADDDNAYQMYLDLLAALRATSDSAKNSIHILANVAMVTKVDAISIGYAAKEIEASDSRYIIISGQNQFISQVYYGMGKLGMLNPTRVWMAVNMPLPLFDNSGFQDDYYSMLKGFIFIQYMSAATNGPKYDQLLESVKELGGIDFAATLSPNWFFQIATAHINYDCTMLMLLGLDRVLKSSPENSVEMLTSGKLNDKLDFTYFKNLGYRGLVADPLELTINGDLAVPFQAFCMTGVGSNMTMFGQTDVNATTFFYYPDTLPVFYGGALKSSRSSIPPPDGPHLPRPEQFQFSTESKEGKLMLFFMISGFVVGLTTLVFTCTFRRMKTIVRTSTTVLFATSIGCMSWLAAIVTLYLPAQGRLICVVQIGLQLLGYCLIVGTVTSKMALNYTLVLRGRKIGHNFSTVRFLGVCIGTQFIPELILFLLWAFNSSHEIVSVPFLDADRNNATPTYITICMAPQAHNGVYTTLLIIYNIFLLGTSIIFAVRTLDVEVFTGESTFATMIVTILTFGGSLSTLAVLANGHAAGGSGKGETEVIMVLAHAGCLWGLAMLVLAVVFVPKSAAVYLTWDAKRRVAGGKPASLSVPRRLRISEETNKVVAKANRGLERLVSGQLNRMGAAKGAAAAQKVSSAGTGPTPGSVARTTDYISPEIEFIALGHHPVKVVRPGQMNPPTWYLCHVAILKLNGRNWINLAHSQGVVTCRFTYSPDASNSTSTIQKVTRPESRLVCIVITPPCSKSAGPATLWIELENDNRMDEFVQMFQAAATIAPRENDLLRNLMPVPSE
ncbi:hypothetical protein HDU80_011564 [Chytriomyces hyalinus]|nr:hypothetical protein HDU80_011564 [Chytriomyces hyalinus]